MKRHCSTHFSRSVALRRQHINALSLSHYLGVRRATMSAPAAQNAAGPQNAAAPTVGTDTVHVLHEPATGTPTCDVLFFHGLQPVSYDQAWKHTWENDDKVLWPAEWLGKDFPTARVMSISYDSRAAGGKDTMDDLANILVNEICLLAKVGQDRPVVLVGHSLGGLVLKKLALEAKKQSGWETTPLQDCCKAFCDNLAGTFFYATPHGGAQLGSFADYVLGGVGAGGPVLKYLQVFSSQGADLNNEFRRTFPTLCFMALVETKDYKPLGFLLPGVKVVAEGSAKQGMDNYVLMKADHISICKPKSTDDGAYRYLKEYLDFALESLKKRQSALATVLTQPLPQATALDVGNKMDELLRRYTKEVQPAMNWIKDQKERLEPGLGTRWPEGLFPYDTPHYKLEVTDQKNVARDYWNAVVNLCEMGALDDRFFKMGNMAGRAQEYRLLVEPVEICNYYHGDMHLDKPDKPTRGHYIDRITVELEDDNHIRPSRFQKLQQIEQRVLPQKEVNYVPKSSLGLARELKERVGDLTWKQYQTQDAGSADSLQ